MVTKKTAKQPLGTSQKEDPGDVNVDSGSDSEGPQAWSSELEPEQELDSSQGGEGEEEDDHGEEEGEEEEEEEDAGPSAGSMGEEVESDYGVEGGEEGEEEEQGEDNAAGAGSLCEEVESDYGDEEDGEDEEEQEEEEEEQGAAAGPGILGDVNMEAESDYGDEGEEEDLMAGSSGSDDEDDDVSGEEEGEGAQRQRAAGAGPSQVPAKFLEGEKGASFAKAFAKILQQNAKVKKAAAEGEDAGGAQGAPETILAESKSVGKRKAEELEAAKASRAAKKLRVEMRRRGHAKVPRKGVDPAADLREKQLARLATRGVVLLFNAVSKAQKAKQESGGAGERGSKPVRLNKASFLTQLKGAEKAAAQEGGVGKGGVLGLKKEAGAEQAPGWHVLHDSYSGLPGTSKMKDWDKEQRSDSDGGAPERIDVESEDGGDDGW